ncbi:potassium channel family protein [Photobacterium leiognathi]|uniref:potassium channel family protein n=1 Tax=Photobacterium leiognathi TaxID=553611 RepID=UPI0029813F83|nr:potassium channel family protein [Photobacterium leiognathi]
MKKKITLDNNFIFFVITILSFLIVLGLSPTISNDDISISFFICFILLLKSLSYSKRWLKYLLSLLLLYFFGEIVIRYYLKIDDIYFTLVILFLYLYGVARNISVQILHKHCKLLNKIIGSFGLYIILGMMWAVIYSLSIYIYPGSISGLNTGNNIELFVNTLYFSFVVLSSLGFGDILPHTAIMKMLVSLEAMMGLFYIAVVVSTLVNSKSQTE